MAVESSKLPWNLLCGSDYRDDEGIEDDAFGYSRARLLRYYATIDETTLNSKSTRKLSHPWEDVVN